MSAKKTLLEKIINTIFGQSNQKKEVFKRRSLSIESLETRELLSVSTNTYESSPTVSSVTTMLLQMFG